MFALKQDLSVRRLECVLGIECSFPPRGFAIGVLSSQLSGVLLLGGSHGLLDSCPRLDVGIEESA